MHIAQLIPLPLTISCCSKCRLAHPGSPGHSPGGRETVVVVVVVVLISANAYVSTEFYLSTGLFTNIVTFRKEDATISFPTFKAGASGDIRFQFMTTAMDGILVQNTGPFDFIEVRLVCELHAALVSSH